VTNLSGDIVLYRGRGQRLTLDDKVTLTFTYTKWNFLQLQREHTLTARMRVFPW
jgi:hypothetical protein